MEGPNAPLEKVTHTRYVTLSGMVRFFFGQNVPDKPERIQTKSGKWYLWAECEACHQAIPVFGPILPDAPIAGGDFTIRQMRCPNCGTLGDYPLSSLQRLQVPPGETIQ